jgi:GxxExxY protein
MSEGPAPKPAPPVLSENELSHAIIGAAIEVHRELGPGLLESAYERAMVHELTQRAIPLRRQVALPLKYKNVLLDCDYKIDLLVANRVIVELKCIDQLAPVHEAQLLTYLKLSGCPLGLLINFNVPLLKDGIKRIVHNLR